uniref:Adducin 2 (beta) n=1 Tax=Callorhinchus milii TaxID=7868 RepID=A0A4W3IJ98_CALMI
MSSEPPQEEVPPGPTPETPGPAPEDPRPQHVPEDDPETPIPGPDPSLGADPIEQKKRVSMILRSPEFRDELESLIQEQMKKGNFSPNLLALRQIVDFMTSTPSVIPTSPPGGVSMIRPINDLQTIESLNLVKGERLMRCKIASIYRLLDLFGWAQLVNTYVTLRVRKEQDHFLIIPRGLSYGEVTASVLVKVNILGEVVSEGSSGFSVDVAGFSLHSAIYAARPDIRCVIHLHTPATAAVSAMRCGLLSVSHEALLVGEVAYYDYNGVLILRNHGVVALGETMEEAFYKIYHLQSACEIQISSLSSAGGVENVIMLDRDKYRRQEVGSVGWAGSTFGRMRSSRVGEHEFEALMRMLDNLGYRTGYAYRYPVIQERTKHKREVEIPATVTAFSFEEEPLPLSSLRHHSQRQQQEKTRWLNSPNTYLRVNVNEETPWGPSSPRAKTTWLKADEVTRLSSGTSIKIETPNQFVPLFTDPREVLETRNKIREQNRQDMKSAGPQSQLLASVITDKSRSPVSDSHTSTYTLPTASSSPHSSPLFAVLSSFSHLLLYLLSFCLPLSPRTSYFSPLLLSPSLFFLLSLCLSLSISSLSLHEAGDLKDPGDAEIAESEVLVVNGEEEERSAEDELSKGISQMMSNAENGTETPAKTAKEKPEPGTGGPLTPEGSPSKSPSKKKKKFRTPSFLKKSKKEGEERAKHCVGGVSVATVDPHLAKPQVKDSSNCPTRQIWSLTVSLTVH